MAETKRYRENIKKLAALTILVVGQTCGISAYRFQNVQSEIIPVCYEAENSDAGSYADSGFCYRRRVNCFSVGY